MLRLDNGAGRTVRRDRSSSLNARQLKYAFVSTPLGTDGALIAAALNEHFDAPFSGGFRGDDR
jgi:hypothetical protein